MLTKASLILIIPVFIICTENRGIVSLLWMYINITFYKY